MQPTPEQRDQFIRDGYVILRRLILSDEVGQLSASVEMMGAKAPRNSSITLTKLVDRRTANALEFCVNDRVYEFSRHLMRAEGAVGVGLGVKCKADTGWHRDIHSYDMAPLDGLQQDIRRNGPPYVQWNIALCDDPYLHMIPGSHLRRNTETERKIERSEGVVPLPGMTCADLKAGDGIVYINAILHSAKPSGENKRRTFHLGFEGFGIRNFAHFFPEQTPGVDFVQHLSPPAEKLFRYFEQLHTQRLEGVADLYRAMIDRDASGFHEVLHQLHPSPDCRMTTLIVLSKVAFRLREFVDGEENKYYNRPYGPRTQALASHFTQNEIHQLWSRFAALDAKLQADEVQNESLFQGPRTKYYVNEMPENFEVEEFVNSWDA